METAIRPTATAVATNIKNWHGELVQLIYLLERQGVRWQAKVASNANFPQHEVNKINCQAKRVEITINGLGLIGHHGALPAYYQNIIAKLDTNHPLLGFLNIFQHRLVHLHYKIWSYNNPVLQKQKSLNTMLTSIAGVKAKPDSSLQQAALNYAALLHRRPLSRRALQQVLADYFAVPVVVQDFVVNNMQIPTENQARLGSAECELGISTLLGEKIQQHQGKCQINVGPLDLRTFRKMLPNADMANEFAKLVRGLISRSLRVNVRLWLDKKAVPKWHLAEKGQRLGQTSWCGGSGFQQDVGDVYYAIN